MRLVDCLQHATDYWAARPGCKTMATRAGVCVRLLGAATRADKLGPQDGARLLTGLRERGLSPASMASYYQTFKRLLKLNGVMTHDWPNPPTPPRKTRRPMSPGDYERVVGWLLERGFRDTVLLATALDASGIRVGVEALRPGNLRVVHDSPDTLSFHVRGKGGHERIVPVAKGAAGDAMVSLCASGPGVVRAHYWTHRRRWNTALEACGIDRKEGLATLHSLRHKYATEVLRGSGGNLRLVQELLGHSNPGTTARYVEISMADKLEALQRRTP